MFVLSLPNCSLQLYDMTWFVFFYLIFDFDFDTLVSFLYLCFFFPDFLVCLVFAVCFLFFFCIVCWYEVYEGIMGFDINDFV